MSEPRPSDEGASATLRDEVRAVIARSNTQLYAMSDAWMRGYDTRFTALIAEQGLIGLTWPESLGGRAANNTDRMVVTEELLRVGAPVAAHWIADRQIGPAILRHGTPELQQQFLPRIAAGEFTFCLGMSETESGSDLAAVRTRAVADGDVYRITGSKIWTSHAHRATHAYVLARTGDAAVDKHDALTEFVVDLATPGIEVRPIYDLAGEHHFNEVVLTNVMVPAGNVIGAVGAGWQQVTEQLAFERGGMERVLSTYPLLAALFAEGHPDPAGLGELLARLHTLRALAFAVAAAMDAGRAPVQQAALLKFLGNTFEGDVVDFARASAGVSPDPEAAGLEGLLARSITAIPGATIRGGTTEVLLTIVGRQELTGRTRPADSELAQAIDDVLTDVGRSAKPAELGALWATAVELGWVGIGVAEHDGGSGGTVTDLATIATGLGRHAQPGPVWETALAAGVLAEAGRPVAPGVPMTVGLGAGITLGEGSTAGGRVSRVAWARAAEVLVLAANDGQSLIAVESSASGISLQAGSNLAGEPRDTLVLRDVEVRVIGDAADVTRLRAHQQILQVAAIVGALRAAHNEACRHVQVRQQFGKPLAAFQAVAHNIARMAAEVAGAEVALARALVEAESGGSGWSIAAARIVAGRAAGTVAKIAHQSLGAMGITREHDLHLTTLRLWSWRDEGIDTDALTRRLGTAALEQGRDAVWDWCVGVRDLGGSPWEVR